MTLQNPIIINDIAFIHTSDHQGHFLLNNIKKQNIFILAYLDCETLLVVDHLLLKLDNQTLNDFFQVYRKAVEVTRPKDTKIEYKSRQPQVELATTCKFCGGDLTVLHVISRNGAFCSEYCQDEQEKWLSDNNKK